MHFARAHRLFVLSVLLCGAQLAGRRCTAAQHPFTAEDEIRLYHFGDPYSGHPEGVFFSPDQRYFVVVAERGLLQRNRPETTLRIYSSEGVRNFLSHAAKGNEPTPLWILKESTFREGPLVTNLRWLADSESFAFLLKGSSGHNQLVLAHVKSRTVQPLTPENQRVTAFDIRNRMHFVYAVWSTEPVRRSLLDRSATSLVGTGRPLNELLFSDDPEMLSDTYDRSELWAVVGGRRFAVRDSSSRQIVYLYLKGQEALALSPNGRFAVTARAVPVVPPDWEVLFRPPTPSLPYRIRAGQQDLSSSEGTRYVSEYVLVDLLRGSSVPLTGAPMGEAAGWYGMPSAAWSEDGRSVVLSNSFLGAGGVGSSSQPRIPCVAAVDVQTHNAVCLDQARRTSNENYITEGAEFLPGNPRQIWIKFYRDGALHHDNYIQKNDGSWELVENGDRAAGENILLRVAVRERFDSPPVLVATEEMSKISRVIWDPNPQLKELALSDVSVFHWKDQAGRDWIGGLYKPIDYVRDHRYPLVIQTHGFHQDQFQPSGVFPTGFAAQQLASAGFIVLQVRDCPGRVTPDEGPCNVDGYKSAVQALVEEGMVDPERVGIVGFSRTCFYVLEALTSASVRFKAASITDGVNEGYLQYLTSVDDSQNAVAREADVMNGGRPFGSGLQKWLKNSPEFNLDKVQAPLQVVASGRASTLFIWEPYAALRYLNKPVDLMVLNSSEHVLTNPKARLISQGGTVDWFRFWLKDEEDTNPAKIAQYVRWRRLRDLAANHETIPRLASETPTVSDLAR